MRDQQAGVTLIEILVVLVVIAVASGGAVALLVGDRSAPPLSRAVVMMSQDIERARIANVSRLSGIEMRLTEDGYSIRSGGIETRRDLPGNVRLNGAPAQFIVSPLGLPHDLQPLSVALTSGAQTKRLQFDGLTLRDVSGAPNAQE